MAHLRHSVAEDEHTDSPPLSPTGAPVSSVYHTLLRSKISLSGLEAHEDSISPPVSPRKAKKLDGASSRKGKHQAISQAGEASNGHHSTDISPTAARLRGAGWATLSGYLWKQGDKGLKKGLA